ELRHAVEVAVRRLGGGLPGEPMRLAEAEAGYLIALLRLVPWGWPSRAPGSTAPPGEVAARAARLLLADHASGVQPGREGLAWLLMADEDW
ncbi:MAG: hypothetical protein ACK5LS_03660, partial [Propioniciclava sp.]